jgi:hypothetical protein
MRYQIKASELSLHDRVVIAGRAWDIGAMVYSKYRKWWNLKKKNWVDLTLWIGRERLTRSFLDDQMIEIERG